MTGWDQPSHEEASNSASRHIVLVHGTAHTGRCWDLLRPELESRGFVVHCPTLSGRQGSARRSFAPGLHAWVNDVISVMDDIGHPVTLVGHSLGGLVVSGVGERVPARVQRIVYLTALVPKIGRMSQMAMPPLSKALTSTIRPHLNGTASWSPSAAASAFYNRCTPEVQKFAIERLCAQPLLGMMSSMKVTDQRLGAIEKHYIETTDDNAVPLTSQRQMQQNQSFASIHSLDSDHSPFYSMPGVLAARIDQIAHR